MKFTALSDQTAQTLAFAAEAGRYPEIPVYQAENLPEVSLPSPESPDAEPLSQILNGQDWPVKAREYLSVKSPATLAHLATFQISSGSDLVTIEEAAFQGHQHYCRTPRCDRAIILDNLALQLDRHQEFLTRLIALEAGKPVKFASVEVSRAIKLARFYADKVRQIDKMEASAPRDMGSGYETWEFLRPLGPVLAYTPFNFPLNLVMHKLAPAIGAGASIVIKPSPRTPLTAHCLAKLAVAAGYQPVSVVHLDNHQAQELVKSSVFKVFSFTGGAVGWQLARLAPVDTVKILEMGSNAALIVEDLPPQDRLEVVARQAVLSAFGFAGQSCIATQRIFINQTLYQDFLQAFERAMQLVMQGDVLDHTVDLGPMIRPEAARLAADRIEEGLAAGARLLGDTDRNRILYEGWLKPTALVDTTPQMAVNRCEMFAPVVTITPYQSFEQALAMANETELGIHAGLYTQSMETAQLAQQTLNVRGLNINEVPSYRDDRLPYGGINQSGIGAEGVDCGIENYSQRVYRLHNSSF